MGLMEEVAREIGSKTKEFYEFVLPPVDMRIRDGSAVVQADMPGFEKKNIEVTLRGRTLHIRARKEEQSSDSTAADGKKEEEEEGDSIIYTQRPGFVDKKIRLPAVPYHGGKRGDDAAADRPAPTAEYKDGILTVVIPIRRRSGLDIAVR